MRHSRGKACHAQQAVTVKGQSEAELTASAARALEHIPASGERICHRQERQYVLERFAEALGGADQTDDCKGHE